MYFTIHIFNFFFSFRQEAAKGHEGFDRRPASEGAEATKERIVLKSRMRTYIVARKYEERLIVFNVL